MTQGGTGGWAGERTREMGAYSLGRWGPGLMGACCQVPQAAQAPGHSLASFCCLEAWRGAFPAEPENTGLWAAAMPVLRVHCDPGLAACCPQDRDWVLSHVLQCRARHVRSTFFKLRAT